MLCKTIMKTSSQLIILFGVVLIACCWALLGPNESAENAFSRIINNPPASLVLREYWKAQGMGGDGLNAFTFSVSQNDIVKWITARGWQLIPVKDEADKLLLTVEFEKVEKRISEKLPIQPPYSHYFTVIPQDF